MYQELLIEEPGNLLDTHHPALPSVTQTFTAKAHEWKKVDLRWFGFRRLTSTGRSTAGLRKLFLKGSE